MEDNKKLTNREILDTISNEWTKNRCVVVKNDDGVFAAPIYAFINQDYQSILLALDRGFTDIYNLAAQADNDLNGIYTGVNKQRFINDLAASYTIKTLKEKIEEVENTNVGKLQLKVKEQDELIKKLNMEIAYLKYN